MGGGGKVCMHKCSRKQPEASSSQSISENRQKKQP